MGWFITQSLAFIIIAALIGLAIGIWIGWLVWGRRAKGKHTAEKAEVAARTDAASGSGSPSAAAGTEAAAPAETASVDAEPDADAGSATDADADTADAPDETDETDGADGADGADVVAEAEAVARRAAEKDAAEEDAAEPAETPDDLRRIEGIGPKIAAALVAAGYPTYARIAAATEAELREAVAGQGIRFAPSAASWADQAQYLVDNDADGLQEYQDYLVGGQERRGKFTENVDYTDVDEIEGAEARAAAIAADEAAAAEAQAQAEPEPEPEPQDLRRIEGIGPKIDATLKAAGYTTYAKVAAASETELREALATGGIKFAPAAASWADQAQYLADGDEDGLQEYQDYLVGGQDRAAKFRKDVDYTDVDEIEDADARAAALTADEARTASDGDTEAAGSEAKA
ncbi:hypothetical protein GCM10027063_11580 [Promicromonospora xylanilytica]